MVAVIDRLLSRFDRLVMPQSPYSIGDWPHEFAMFAGKNGEQQEHARYEKGESMLGGKIDFLGHISRLNARRESAGFMLIELFIVISILGVLFALSVPSYSRYLQEGKEAQAMADLHEAEDEILDYFLDCGRYPSTLEEAGFTKLDPWGNPYEYLSFDTLGNKGKDKKRKDKNLVPINSDYDLYSKGKDGKSVGPLTAKASRDDIVRANNGSFIGRAEDY